MGHIVRTPAGTWRANWRDAAGKQKAKSFPTKKAASGFLAQIETSLIQGLYVDPHAGRQLFGTYAEKWLAARSTELTTTARDSSMMRSRVLLKWSETPIGKIDHLSVQTWITELLAENLAPATVTVCLRLTSNVLRSAIRDRIIATNPCEEIQVPRRRRKDSDGITIDPSVLKSDLLPVVPDRYRALVALAAGTGLRWGEATGLRWDCIDLETCELRVIRTHVEVSGNVAVKPYPKSGAGRRVVPLPDFVIAELLSHRAAYGEGAAGEVFMNSAGGPLRRTLFRSRIWRPALVRAGLLGSITPGPKEGTFLATWSDLTGAIRTKVFPEEKVAVVHIARETRGGLRFHDLRHSYATHLVSLGVPVNVVQRLMGHERASTTLDLYTHHSKHNDNPVRAAFADDPLTEDAQTGPDESRPAEKEDESD